MRNKPFSETELIRKCVEAVRERLPEDWQLTPSFQPALSTSWRPDAVLELRDPAGNTATIILEVKARVEPRDIPALVQQLQHRGGTLADTFVLLAPYLGERTREQLGRERIGYYDATGNLRLALSRPAIFLESRGADRDPWPGDQPLRSLRGRAGGRAARAFADFRPPYGIRQLSTVAAASAPSLSRVADLLEREALLIRERARGTIVDVDWRGVLRRWSQDYSFAAQNRIQTYLEPRGLPSLFDKLRGVEMTYAITASFASVDLAPIVQPETLITYVPDPAAAASKLGLRLAETGANVILAEPYDPVVFERTRTRNGLIYAGVTQVAVDLLKGPERNPSEAEALIDWMAENEELWRMPIQTS